MNLILPLFLSVAMLAGFGCSYSMGYDSAEQKYTAKISTLKRSYMQANAAAMTTYQSRLNDALDLSHKSSRKFLSAQASLRQQNQLLKEQLNEATINTHCAIDANWLRHYRAALGVSATRSDGDDSTGGTNDTTTTTAALLRHATDFGLWCRSNTEQLIELQGYLKGVDL